jgi:hypothetical protein
MTEPEKRPVIRFRDAVSDVCEYYTREYNMTYEEMIGCFEMMKLSLFDQYMTDQEEDDE